MLKSLTDFKTDLAITLLRRRLLGYLGNVHLGYNERKSADRLTPEGVLSINDHVKLDYRMSSPLVDGLILSKLLHVLYPVHPTVHPPYRANHSLDVVETIERAVALFDEQHMAGRWRTTSKSSGGVTVHNIRKCQVPQESIYDTELMRILCNWPLTCQWLFCNDLKKFTNIITLTHVVLLHSLATGTRSDINSHINKMLGCMMLLSATEAWTVHFPCEDDFVPIDPSPDVSSKSVNVLHLVHDLDWTRVVVHGYWRDHTELLERSRIKLSLAMRHEQATSMRDESSA